MIFLPADRSHLDSHDTLGGRAPSNDQGVDPLLGLPETRAGERLLEVLGFDGIAISRKEAPNAVEEIEEALIGSLWHADDIGS